MNIDNNSYVHIITLQKDLL